MAYSKYTINSSTMTSLADAVRNLNNITTTLTPSQMISQINAAKSYNRCIVPYAYNGSTITTISGSYEFVCDKAFEDCRALRTVNLPQCRYLDYHAFTSCFTLDTVNIPNCRYIGTYAFGATTSTAAPRFTVLSVPYCEFIDGNAFRYCSLFSSLYLNKVSRVTSLPYSVAFYGTPIALGTGKIYVPSSLRAQFVAHNQWGLFSNAIVGV